ncbi:MAG: phosphoribosylanthranilate isomerase [Isosphaeraceae bacterium]
MSSFRVRVKICGVTSPEDAQICAEMGADWIGLNFHPGSPRYIERGVASEIIDALPDSMTVVGVFVDRPPLEVAEVAERLGLDIVQLHGHEPPEDLLRLGPIRVIRAFRLGHPSAWEGVRDYLAQADALGHPLDGVLVDAHVPGQHGGTGASITDEILDCRVPLPRLILAGGLTPRNVADRISKYRPWMVDVASGVESAPGRKDPASVAAFIRAARGAIDDLHESPRTSG